MRTSTSLRLLETPLLTRVHGCPGVRTACLISATSPLVQCQTKRQTLAMMQLACLPVRMRVCSAALCSSRHTSSGSGTLTLAMRVLGVATGPARASLPRPQGSEPMKALTLALAGLGLPAGPRAHYLNQHPRP